MQAVQKFEIRVPPTNHVIERRNDEAIFVGADFMLALLGQGGAWPSQEELTATEPNYKRICVKAYVSIC